MKKKITPVQITCAIAFLLMMAWELYQVLQYARVMASGYGDTLGISLTFCAIAAGGCLLTALYSFGLLPKALLLPGTLCLVASSCIGMVDTAGFPMLFAMNLLLLIADGLLFLLSVVNLFPHKPRICRKAVCLLPALCALAGAVLSVPVYLNTYGVTFDRFLLSGAFPSFVVTAAAYALLGLWLAEGMKVKEKALDGNKEKRERALRTKKLAYYRDQLNKGVITAQEYQTKKAELEEK